MMPHRPRSSTADVEALHCLQRDIPNILSPTGSSKPHKLNKYQGSRLHSGQIRSNNSDSGCRRCRDSALLQQQDIPPPTRHESSMYTQDHNKYSTKRNVRVFKSYEISKPKCKDAGNEHSPVEVSSPSEDDLQSSTLVANISPFAIGCVQNSCTGQSYQTCNSKGHGQRTMECPGSNAPSYPDQPPDPPTNHGSTFDITSDGHNDTRLHEEIDQEIGKKWILNLSMHFKDDHDREKFFITYAEAPNRWRRVTVSCDYRDAAENTLEGDLRTLHFQRDKSARIYESIRESLPDIQFYETVTNLKLKTEEGRLHVHVTEDVNEIIKYPLLSAIRHLDCQIYPESLLSFDSHMSGFVYTVTVDDYVYVKKEIPSPDTVEEFLYEVNALFALRCSNHVIEFIGVVSDDQSTCVKGLLIGYASGGALVDILHDNNDPQIPWAQREEWAQQIIKGLSDIHETGFVQGDFTLSNIVLDVNNAAKIIDINRRGCPVGWEPPELEGLIEDGQRISMYIGVKSDIFQLGMVLWALAVHLDEPERQDRPLILDEIDPEVPDYFLRIIKSCLELNPSSRKSAKALLDEFPAHFQSKDIDRLFSTASHPYEISMIDPALSFTSEGFGEARQIPPDHDWNSSINYEILNNIVSSPRVNPSESFMATGETKSSFGPPAHQDSGFSEDMLSSVKLESTEAQNYYTTPRQTINGPRIGDNLAEIEAHTIDEHESENPQLH